jgi:hypothetical protein
VVAAQVEPDRGRQVTALARVEDLHRVDDGPPVQRERHARSVEFSAEDSQVVASQIEPAQIAAVKKVRQPAGDLREARLMGDVAVGDAVNGRRLRWDWDAGVHASGPLDAIGAGPHAQDADLDHAGRVRVGPRGFEVEDS